MTFTLACDQFPKLEAELLASHQVVLSANSPDGARGTVTSVDGKIAGTYNFIPETRTLDVELTKHDGYPWFIADAGLKSKLDAAIKAL